MPVPPSFSSFPDLEGSSGQGPETAPVSAQQGDPRDKEKGSDRKKRKRDRRDKHSNPARTPSRERGRGKQDDGYIFDDERKKAEEDSARRTRQPDVSQQAFFSDKKGDHLSVQYGGIYSRDVPKYHLVGRA
jgi:hypothetical protein